MQHGADCKEVSYDDELDLLSYFTPISVLVMDRDAPMDLFDLLITSENINENPIRLTSPPLHVASRFGHVNIAVYLNGQEARVNQEDGYQNLPLHIAIDCGHTNLASSLMELGSSLNQEDVNCCLPLHLAVSHGYAEIALSLIRHGASVNQNNVYGNLPLHLAHTQVKQGHTDLALSLIEHGASVNQEDGDDDLPLHLALREGRIELAFSLIKLGASVNHKDGSEDLPLQLAVEHGYTDLAKSLIMLGASVNQENGRGHLPVVLCINKCFNEELFLKLIPGNSMDILKAMCDIFRKETEPSGKEILFKALTQLLQRLILIDPLSITIKLKQWYGSRDIHMKLKVNLNQQPLKLGVASFKPVFLCSVLLILVGCDVSFPDAIVPRLSVALQAKHLSCTGH